MLRRGVSVIEVIIAIGMAAIVIAAVGNLSAATQRLATSGGRETQATNFAQQWVEVLASQANQSFGCSCGATNPCPGNSCSAGGQSCTPRTSAGFNSCWLPQPLIGACVTPNVYKLHWDGSTWALACADATNASDTDIHPIPGYTRSISLINLQRDSSGNIVSSGGTVDPNTKQATISISWTDHGATRQTSVSTILTAWKNF